MVQQSEVYIFNYNERLDTMEEGDVYRNILMAMNGFPVFIMRKIINGNQKIFKVKNAINGIEFDAFEIELR